MALLLLLIKYYVFIWSCDVPILQYIPTAYTLCKILILYDDGGTDGGASHEQKNNHCVFGQNNLNNIPMCGCNIRGSVSGGWKGQRRKLAHLLWDWSFTVVAYHYRVYRMNE